MNNSLKIVMDKAIPYRASLFESIGQVTALDADDIHAGTIKDADVLIVRSVTQVDSQLLSGSNIKFVGTATIGTDHIDTPWLQDRAIGFSSAPGCNSVAVVQYVLSAISYWLEQQPLRSLQDLTIGIVGVGEIGGRLHSLLNQLGVKTLLCDPPRSRRGELGHSVELNRVLLDSDVITLHVPLNHKGEDKTYRFITYDLLNAMSEQQLLINAARGALIDPVALSQLDYNGPALILDVWPEEPVIADALLSRVILGTPHIAGYSIEGKLNASYQIYRALTSFFKLPALIEKTSIAAEPEKLDLINAKSWEQCFLTSYPIQQDYRLLLEHYKEQGAEGFKYCRTHYSFRHDFLGQFWKGKGLASELKAKLDLL